MRALEIVTRTGLPLSACQTRRPVDANVFILGLHLPREEHYRRLDDRVDAQFAAGLVEEVRGLRARGLGDARPVRGGIGYREVSLYLDGEIDMQETVRRVRNANHRLVRRQHAWFKEHDPRIGWIDARQNLIENATRAVAEWLQGRGTKPM
jgi:tRNA dimethylallyltransferase